MEIVLKVQAITYPRTSCVRSSIPVFGPYLTMNPDRSALGPCNLAAAKLEQCFMVKDRVLMAVESVLLI